MNISNLNNINLDIDNYSINELEIFFKLKNTNYQAKDVELRESNLREKLLKETKLEPRFVRGMIEFLEKAKNILISSKCLPLKNPTTIYNSDLQDNHNYPVTGYRNPPQTRENEIITKENTQYIYTQDSEYFPGDLNPLKKRIISKCLNIDTRFRDNYYNSSSSDFTFQLPIKLNHVVSMQLSSFEIPVSFYGISAYYGNNYINMGVEYTDTDNNLILENKIFVIPDGNYVAQDFIDMLNIKLTSKKVYEQGLSDIIIAENIFSYIKFTLDINTNGSGTGKITLTTNSLYENQLNLSNPITIHKIIMDFRKDINGVINNNIDLNTKIGWNLGFTKPIYDSSSIYIGESLVEPATVRYIYLAIDDFNNQVNNMFVSAFNKSIFSPNIIARISIKGLYFSLLMENDLNIVTEPRVYFGPVDIQKLQVRLYDDFGRIIDMNHGNFSFSLIIKMLYNL